MQNKHILLTGATGGIGKAIAKALVLAGANITLLGKNLELLQDLQDDLKRLVNKDQQISYLLADLCDPHSIQTLAAEVSSQMPSIDTLINCAGLNEFALFEDLNNKQIQNIIQLNTVAPMSLCHALLAHLKKQNNAMIVNVGSTFGSIAYPGFSVYSASKFALRGFSQALAIELSDSNVKVKYLSPRATTTKLNTSNIVAMNQAMKIAMDSPEIVAQECLKLMNSNKHYRAIGWPEKFFAWLNQVAPAIVSKSITKQLSTIQHYARSHIS